MTDENINAFDQLENRLSRLKLEQETEEMTEADAPPKQATETKTKTKSKSKKEESSPQLSSFSSLAVKSQKMPSSSVSEDAMRLREISVSFLIFYGQSLLTLRCEGEEESSGQREVEKVHFFCK